MASSKEVVKLVKQAERWPGWRVEQKRNGYAIFPPDKGLNAVIVHLSESDHRAMANTLARLRQCGAPL
jgi:hypothetical protein